MYAVPSHFLLLASSVTSVIAAPTLLIDSCLSTALAASSTPIPPTNDSWYIPDGTSWRTAQPGDVLRFRNALGDATIGGAASAVYNILYRTTDSHNNPSWAVTTVYAPADVNDTNGFKMLSYQHLYDSADLNQSPSYLIYDKSDKGSALSLFIQQYLKKGWFVNVPDYEGPKAAFGSGHVAGRATLDSVRAFRNAAQCVGVPTNSDGGVSLKYAMYGYSGGSFATEWAVELQKQYAPELQFSGAAVGGLYPNLTKTLEILPKIEGFEGYLREGIIGIGNEHEEVQALALLILGKSTWAEAAAVVRSMSSEELQVAVNQIMGDQTVKEILTEDGLMGTHDPPQMPLFIHRADQDQLSASSDTTELYDAYCKLGASVYYHLNPAQVDDPHVSEALNGASEYVLGYLDQMYEEKFPAGCGTVNATWSWNLTMT